MKFLEITPENVEKEGVYCLKNKKEPGRNAKVNWYKDVYENGYRMVIGLDDEGKQCGLIEYVPAEHAWRPVIAENRLFIQCLVIFSKKDQSRGGGGQLIRYVIEKARMMGKSGVCSFASKGSWMAGPGIFTKSGFESVGEMDRFQLMYHQLESSGTKPGFIDWFANAKKLKGWHLFYSNQCPYHDKAVRVMAETAVEFGVELKVTELNNASSAQKAPTGFGVFGLVRDGKILEDHYLSQTRFKTILKNELKSN